MDQSDKFYTEEVELFNLHRSDAAIIKGIIGHKVVRGEAKEYFDLRVWYTDDSGVVRPGKGFAKPFTKEELKLLGTAIIAYAEGR